MDPVTKAHNDNAGRIVSDIVKTPIKAGGDTKAVMVLLESVIVGVCTACIKLGGDEAVLDVVFTGARQRLAELRLKDRHVGGNG